MGGAAKRRRGSGGSCRESRGEFPFWLIPSPGGIRGSGSQGQTQAWGGAAQRAGDRPPPTAAAGPPQGNPDPPDTQRLLYPNKHAPEPNPGQTKQARLQPRPSPRTVFITINCLQEQINSGRDSGHGSLCSQSREAPQPPHPRVPGAISPKDSDVVSAR